MTRAEPDAYELDYLRRAVRLCLRAQPLRSSNALVGMQTERARGEQKLSRPPAPVVHVDAQGKSHRQPHWARWTSEVHATNTRPPGFSREAITEVDFTDSRYVRAIWTLQSTYIQSLLARYAPGKERRKVSARHLAAAAAARYPTAKVRQRARMLALTVLLNPGVLDQLHEVFGMTPQEWRASRHRKTLYEIRAWLGYIDEQSLMAWQAATGI